MRVLVMGAGALGTVAGGFMARAGHAVTLVGREAHMHAIAEHGLRITGIWGEHEIAGLQTATSVDTVAGEPFDLVLVAVKSYDTAAVAESLDAVLGTDTLVCAYQNGLGNAETLGARLGRRRVIGARVIFGARIPGPGHADVTVIASPTAVGVYDEATPVDRVHAVVDAMEEAGLPTVYTESIETVLWAKVAYNCALNPLSALMDAPYGVLAENEATRAIMDEAIEELYAVGHAMDVALDPPSAGQYRQLFYETLLPPTAAHYASMREDILLGRRTEIDALNGALVRYGEVHSVATPVNQLLTRLIRGREYARRRSPDGHD